MKMLVSDYDSTFYINDEDIKRNVKVVNDFMNRDNNYFVIATGRSYFDFMKKKKLYNINYDYLIINHGATIIKNDQVIYNFPIDDTIKRQIIDTIDFSSLVSYFLCSGIDSRVSIDNDNITKINMLFDSVFSAKNAFNLLTEKFSDYINIFLVCSDKALEIVAKNVDKAVALRWLQDDLNFKTSDIYVIGDNYTDYEMIKKYNGYAMIDSVDEVKNIANSLYNSVSDLVSDIMNGIV